MKRIPILLSSCFALLSLSTVFADPGFYLPTDPSIPVPVQRAAKSVYRFVIAAPQPFGRILAAERSDFETLLARKDPTLFRQLSLSDCASRIILADLKRTKKSDDFLIHALATGTAFFIDKETLVTNRHNFNFFQGMPSAYLQAQSVEQLQTSLKGWKPRFLLIDSDNNIVFDTELKGNSIAEVVFDGHPLRRAGLDGQGPNLEFSSARELLDFMVLRLKGVRGGAKVLKVERNPVLNAETPLYAIGYPKATNGRQSEFKVPDSDGDSLRVSKGSYLERPDDGYLNFLKSLMPDEAVRQYYERGMLFTDIDFVTGNSGGPVVGANGNVVSIATVVRHDFTKTPESAYTLTLSMGTRMSVIESQIPKR